MTGSSAVPSDGDVLVRRDRVGGVRLYVLSSAPNRDTLTAPDRANAISQAVGFAKFQGVRASLIEGEDRTLLIDCRPATSE